MPRFGLILAFVLLLCGYSRAQSTIDSLMGVVNGKTHDTLRIDAYLELGVQVYLNDAHAAITYWSQGAELALQHINDANEPNLFTYRKLHAEALNNIGVVHRKMGDYAGALDYYFRCLEVREQLGIQAHVAITLSNISVVYNTLNELDHALEYAHRARVIYMQEGLQDELDNVYTTIGLIFKKDMEYDSAHYYYTLGLEIRLETQDSLGIAQSYNNLGVLYEVQEDYETALSYYYSSLHIKELINDELGLAFSYLNVADTYLSLNKYDSVYHYLNAGLDYATEWGSNALLEDYHNNLSMVYEDAGNYKEALYHLNLYVLYHDSLFNDDNASAIATRELQFEFAKKQMADSLESATEQELLTLQIREGESQLEKEKTQRLALYGGIALLLVLGVVGLRGYQRKKKDNELIKEQKQEVEHQKLLVDLKNQEITDSITYAKRIQHAILPSGQSIKEHLGESFVLYKPKDIVAGDFYWLEKTEDKVLFAVADCTGHGVPGAMVSVICNNALNRSVREYGLNDPGEILNKTREIVVQEFEKSDEEVKDGMDIALCAMSDKKLEYAGAHNPLWLMRKGEIIETKADKQPIGNFENAKPYTAHSLDLQQDDMIFIFSDGFVDQFGGPRGKKFKAKTFRELLLSIQDRNMEEQRLLINEEFEQWRGDLEQVDDVCVIGVKV